MRKYIEIAKLHLKSQLAWRADAVFNMLFTVCKILFAYLLWSTIFKQNNSVAGFTFHGILSYYIISSFLSQLDMSAGISGEISSRIRNGTFSNYMVLPVNAESYFLFQEIGTMLFYLLFDFAAAVIWIFIFRIDFALTTDPYLLVCELLMIPLGLFFMLQLNYFLGLLTLKYQEISTFLMIKDNLMMLVTGAIVPLVLFPEKLLVFLRSLPFYYVTYLPSMLLTGHCRQEALPGIAALICWSAAIQAAIHVTWKHYRTKYDGVGI